MVLNYNFWTLTIKICTSLYFLILTHEVVVAISPNLCTDYEISNTAIVNIVLDETDGEACDEIKLHAIHEKAAIQYAIYNINSGLKRDGYDIKIQANIFDSCSKVNNVKKVALKALVSSEQTCPEPPLLLGFIGPQEEELLKETKKVTNVFSSLHILGYNSGSDDDNRREPSSEYDNTLYLFDNYIHNKYEVILTTLKKVNWSSFILIVDDSELSSSVGNLFLNDDAYSRHQTDEPCVVGDILKLPKEKAEVYNFYKKLILELETGHQDGLVIVVNDMSNELAEFLRKFGTENPTILSINKMGTGSWQIPKNNQFFLLQEVSNMDMTSDLSSFINKTAYDTFIKQQESIMKSAICINKDEVSCSNQKLAQDILYTQHYDSSIIIHIYSLNLLSSALKTIQRLKCKTDTSIKNICSKLLQINKEEDLNTNIRRTTINYKGDSIRFNMDIDNMITNIYNIDFIDNQLKLVAKIQNKKFELLKNMKLPIKKFKEDDGKMKSKIKCSKYNKNNNNIIKQSTNENNEIYNKKPPSSSYDDSDNMILEETTIKTIVMSTQTSRPSIWNFVPNIRNLETQQDYMNAMVVFIAVGAAFLMFMICAICCVWKCFKIKGANEDRESCDNRSIRSIESGRNVRIERRKNKNKRSVQRNESQRSARSID